MKSVKSIYMVSVVVIVTIIAGVFHFYERQEVPENHLLISYKDEELMIDTQQLEFETVTGTRVNGKGEEISVEALGVSVEDVLNSQNIVSFSNITIISNDSYSVQVSSKEVKEIGKVFFLQQEEGGLRLIVFGDNNSKRSVSDVVQIVIE